VGAAATLEILEPPGVSRLYFWALQVGFHDGRRDRGAGHLGLQWLPDQAGVGRAAVNWGGYRAGPEGGGELEGSESDLPDIAANPNTRGYPWQPGRPYRLAVTRAPGVDAWRASVTDEATGEETVVRDLHVPARWITAPVVWSEVFACCDDPRVVVRWSRLRACTEEGTVVAPTSLTVTYQGQAEGGCANTTVEVDEVGARQVTTADRTVRHGEVVAVPG
jgi:hypothetical protein